jgi:hypothetical protein
MIRALRFLFAVAYYDVTDYARSSAIQGVRGA